MSLTSEPAPPGALESIESFRDRDYVCDRSLATGDRADDLALLLDGDTPAPCEIRCESGRSYSGSARTSAIITGPPVRAARPIAVRRSIASVWSGMRLICSSPVALERPASDLRADDRRRATREVVGGRVGRARGVEGRESQAGRDRAGGGLKLEVRPARVARACRPCRGWACPDRRGRPVGMDGIVTDSRRRRPSAIDARGETCVSCAVTTSSSQLKAS